MVHEAKLSAVLSDLARTLVTDFPIQGILDHLVETHRRGAADHRPPASR